MNKLYKIKPLKWEVDMYSGLCANTIFGTMFIEYEFKVGFKAQFPYRSGYEYDVEYFQTKNEAISHLSARYLSELQYSLEEMS